MSKFPITVNGLEKLKEEIKKLKFTDRPAVVKAIAEAREFGDLSENAEYHAARERQSFIEGRIAELEDKMARAEVIDVNKITAPNITFGATVKIQDDDTEEIAIYQIVGEYEADIARNMISIASPLARALIGKKIGDIVEVVTPRGERGYEVLEIEYSEIKV